MNTHELIQKMGSDGASTDEILEAIKDSMDRSPTAQETVGAIVEAIGISLTAVGAFVGGLFGQLGFTQVTPEALSSAFRDTFDLAFAQSIAQAQEAVDGEIVDEEE